jgi:hypothetical protein
MRVSETGIARRGFRSESERRSSPSAVRWPERRTGFDRRSDQPVTKFLRDNLHVLVGLVVVLNALNLLDFLLTNRALAGGALEANPIMNALFMSGWESAAIFKLGTMLAVSVAVIALRRYRRVLQVAVAGVVLYSAIVLYHVGGIALVG